MISLPTAALRAARNLLSPVLQTSTISKCLFTTPVLQTSTISKCLFTTPVLQTSTISKCLFTTPVLQTSTISKCLFTTHPRFSFIGSNQTMFRPSHQLLVPSTITVEQTRAYQPRGVPKLRCRHCYFVSRHGQLFVECTSKKRHRQFQIVGKSRRFKDDLTKGRFKEFVYNDYKHKRFYRFGESLWSKEDLIGDRIGKDL